MTKPYKEFLYYNESLDELISVNKKFKEFHLRKRAYVYVGFIWL